MREEIIEEALRRFRESRGCVEIGKRMTRQERAFAHSLWLDESLGNDRADLVAAERARRLFRRICEGGHVP